MIGYCRDCIYWESDKLEVKGCCHRNPPTYYDSLVAFFPPMSSKGWCGEFKSKEDVATYSFRD